MNRSCGLCRTLYGETEVSGVSKTRVVIHERMRHREGEGLHFHCPSVKWLSVMLFWSIIIKNGNGFFSCAGEGVFALSKAQGKGKLLLGKRSSVRIPVGKYSHFSAWKRNEQLSVLYLHCCTKLLFFMSCTWSALIPNVCWAQKLWISLATSMKGINRGQICCW